MILAWIQQYLLYVILTLILIIGVQTARLAWSHKNEEISKAEIRALQARLDSRDGLIEDMGLRTKQFADKVKAGELSLSKMRAKHQAEIQNYLQVNFPEDCQEAANAAVLRLPIILPEAWR